MTTKIVTGVYPNVVEIDYAALETRMLAHLAGATDEQIIAALGLENVSPERKRAGLARMRRFMSGEPR